MAFIPFPEGQLGGAIAVNVFAILCALALVSVALRILWLAVQCFVLRNRIKPQEYVFFHTQLGNYAACLLIGMLFNTLAGIVAVPWLMRRGITEGAICIAQGFLLQLGTWASGYFTVAIAIHTFNTLVLRRKQSVITSRSAISVGWALSIFMASVPFILPKPDGDVYGPDGFMCTIRAVYPKAQFMLHVLPILVASILSAIFYSIIYLALRGTLAVKGGVKLSLDPHERWTVAASDNYQRFIARIASSMIWYPIAYVAFLVPYSIMRLLTISGYPVPFEALVFAACCWFALGVVNVFLFYNTFRVLEPAFEGTSYATSHRDVEKSGFYDNSFGPQIEEKKASPFHLPTYVHQRRASTKSNTSSERLLSFHGKSSSQSSLGSSRGSSPRGYGRGDILASPQPALQRAEVVAHSHKSSVSSDGYNSPSQLFRSLPERHRYSPSTGSNSSPRASPTQVPGGLWRSDSWSSSDHFETVTPLRPAPSSDDRYYGVGTTTLSAFGAPFGRSPPRSPPRQLTLLGDRTPSPPTGATISRLPSSQSQNTSPRQRPFLLTGSLDNDDYTPSAYTNPRTPPVPSALTSRR
ncbi:hypothetical protein CC2G_007299 [Coprinopsis cinerea AmutBmut pab1-1]|nr:hypothetical protein CC2G_007299 [Coprinopsis cinerea AmutBmut pab1-1]